jgi:hypothetical protein
MSPLSSRPPFPSHVDESNQDVSETGIRKREVVFQSVTEISRRVRERRAILDGSVLTSVDTGVRFVLQDAMRILGVSKGADVFGMTGRIVPLSELLSLGAFVSADTARFGSTEYEVQPGFLVRLLT